MSESTMDNLNVKIEHDDKLLFSELTHQLGTTPSNAVRMFVRAFNEYQGFPFDTSRPYRMSAEAKQSHDEVGERMGRMVIETIEHEFSVCKVADYSQVDLGAEFCFTGRTDQENSLVCLTSQVPANTTARDGGWRAFRLAGTLDFSLIGILSRVSGVLAACKIGIFAVSTYNTDYILTKAENFPAALDALVQAGYTVVPRSAA